MLFFACGRARCCGGVDALCTDTVCGAAPDVLHSAPKYRKQKLINYIIPNYYPNYFYQFEQKVPIKTYDVFSCPEQTDNAVHHKSVPHSS